MRDVTKYLDLRAASKTKPNAALGGFGLSMSVDVYRPSTPTIITPGAILGAQPAWWLDGSAGTLVDAGSGVCSQWTDSSSNAVNFTFAGAARPSIQAAGLNGKATLRFSTSNYGSNSGVATPAPGTTASYFWAIAKPITIINSGALCGSSSTASVMYSATAGPKLNIYNGSAGAQSSIIVANTWYRVEWLESNQVTDYLQVGGIAGTTGNSGNNPGTGMFLNAAGAGVSVGNWEIAEIFQFLGTPPDSGKRAALAAYSFDKWGI